MLIAQHIAKTLRSSESGNRHVYDTDSTVCFITKFKEEEGEGRKYLEDW